ncbi:MAG: hypothetical protein ACHQ1D_01600 [Nitrososphaerales archaeon]|jgi:predicted transcriptional regulator
MATEGYQMQCPHCKKPYNWKLVKIDVEEFKRLVNDDISPKEIAFRMKINTSTVYKYLYKFGARRGFKVKI